MNNNEWRTHDSLLARFISRHFSFNWTTVRGRIRNARSGDCTVWVYMLVLAVSIRDAPPGDCTVWVYMLALAVIIRDASLGCQY